MSINGVLEDLPLADVLQFIHLGRRTGTLYLWQDEERRAEIGFYDGRIVTAWAPGHRRLGDMLVAKGLIDAGSLETALLYQKSHGDGLSIGHILLEQTTVTREEIYGVVKEQVQETIFDLVTWRHGNFQFEVDALHPLDDFGLSPSELLDNIDINTQMLVLEATRLFDERHRAVAGQREDEREQTAFDLKLKRAGLGRTGEEVAVRPGEEAEQRPRRAPVPLFEAIRCQVISPDSGLIKTHRDRLPGVLARVVADHPREAGTRFPGESTSPIVVVDMRTDGISAREVAILARTRPAAPVVALVASPAAEAAAYDAGALAVADQSLVVADCCRNLIRVLSQPQPQGTFALSLPGGFRRFRRVVVDVHSGLISVTMALNLMHVISESVERAVLFLVHGEVLSAAGAFGFSNAGNSLAAATRGLRLRPDPESVLRRALEETHPQSVDFAEAHLPPQFADLIGGPATGQVVVFPVLGAERPIAVIYTDNGHLDAEIQDIRILELATSQVGIAFENEILRQQLGDAFLKTMPELSES